MAELLRIEDLSAGYGHGVVISGLSLTISEGEALAVLGRNGMGKTTLVATLMGHTTLRRGRIWFRGAEITQMAAHHRAGIGLGWVPQERDIFPSLTVLENLTAVAKPGPWTPTRVFELFPRLSGARHHFGNHLSGGEQQMLAIGRALVLNPALLLLDEPLEGLAPIVVQELLAAMANMIRSTGLAVLLIEQHARQVLPLTDRTIVLERGRIVHQGASPELSADPSRLEKWLGLADR
ncbi:MAG: ABC transporter ATP-binding protein [Thermodesulfobacteriota bacterium]